MWGCMLELHFGAYTIRYQESSYVTKKFFIKVCISRKISLAIINDILRSSVDKKILKCLEWDNQSNPTLHNNLHQERALRDPLFCFDRSLPSTPLGPHLREVELSNLELLTCKGFSNRSQPQPQKSYISAKLRRFYPVLQITCVQYGSCCGRFSKALDRLSSSCSDWKCSLFWWASSMSSSVDLHTCRTRQADAKTHRHKVFPGWV